MAERSGVPSVTANADVEPVSQGYSNYVLGVLFLVYAFNFVDRQVLAILLPQIKEAFEVSDTFMGFLNGFAFVIFYTFAGIPIARYADRGSRRTIIAIGLTVWSCATAASGMAQNAFQLVLARIGVGTGEAAGTPPAHSLLSDYFGPERRSKALAFYAMGIYIGVAAALAGGGWIAQNFGWRTVFMVVGLAGIPLALLVQFTIRELPRGFSESSPVQAIEPKPFFEAIRTIVTNRSLVLIVLATCFQSLFGYGMLVWGPTFLMRVHQMSQLEVGLKLGAAIGIFGSAGCLLGGYLADKVAASDARWYMRLPAIQCAALFPFALGFILAEDGNTALLYFCPMYLLGAMYVGPMHSTIQGLVTPNLRATASALNLFAVNMIGLGLGPLLIGMLNDYSFQAQYGDEAIRYSMLTAAALGLISSPIFWWSSRDLREDMAATRASGNSTAN